MEIVFVLIHREYTVCAFNATTLHAGLADCLGVFGDPKMPRSPRFFYTIRGCPLLDLEPMANNRPEVIDVDEGHDLPTFGSELDTAVVFCRALWDTEIDLCHGCIADGPAVAP
jgi:hypothetical protein